MLIIGIDENIVRDENSPEYFPIISKPALQKADIEWNIDIHTPFQPNSLQKNGIITIAPNNSKNSIPFIINFVKLAIPPTL